MSMMRDEIHYHDNIDEESLKTEPANDDEEEDAPWQKKSTKFPFFLRPTFSLLVCVALIICNLALYLQNRRLRVSVNDNGFTGIYAHGKSWRQFHTYTEYSDVNQTISDAAWAQFTTNGFVAIPHREAAEFGLPLAEDFPDDPSKGVYVLGGFHQLHCVMYLRDTIKDLMAGKNADDKVIHINHCYDALRQSIQCHADDTPLYAPYRSRLTGEGQLRLCHDWNALTKWAREHTACWPTGHCADPQRT